MIEEHALVVAIDASSVWVEAKRESACARCAAGKGCGSAVFQKLFGDKSSVLSVSVADSYSPVSVKVGDEVVIGVEENAVVKNSLVVYGLPLLTVICFAAIGETFANDAMSISRDLASIGGAVVGLIVSIVGLRWYNRSAGNKAGNHPVLLRRVNNAVHHSALKILG